MPSQDSPAILVERVRKSYAGHVAVRDVSLRVPRGTVYGLLGPNGAGKTTTIRMILGLILPDSGTISVLDAPVGAREARDRVGYLPEERGLYRKMQVRRVLRFLARLKGVPGREADVRIDRWLERFDLRSTGQDWGAANVEDLSRGMQQKVQFIGALLHEPELVILDEPFSGLDPVNAQALKDTVLELRRAGRSIVFSTHVMDAAERMCDHVAIIARGEVVVDGALSEVKRAHAGDTRVAIAFDGDGRDRAQPVLADPRLVASFDDQGQRVELRLADGVPSQALLEALVANHVAIARFDRLDASLHGIFLERVGASGVEAGMSGHG